LTYSPNVRAALAALAPPPKLQLSTWMEEHIRLPAGDAAVPGRIRLYGYQRGIADAIGDPLIERVTVIKSARIGYTTLLVGALANYVHNDPSSLLCLLPVKDDARNFVVSQVEPVFAESPVVRAKLDAPKSHAHDRDTMLFRRFTGGSLRVVSAEAQRNLRSHAARILIVDEADACGTGAEGDSIDLAEKRTLTFANRKILIGSTPTFESSSVVLQRYRQSDQRVFEVPCPECGAFFELLYPARRLFRKERTTRELGRVAVSAAACAYHRRSCHVLPIR
jgi:phage terminase large subunit GpA-like protein